MQTRRGVLAINRLHSIKTSSFCSAHRQICKLHLRYHLFLAFVVFSQVKIYYRTTYVRIHESLAFYSFFFHSSSSFIKCNSFDRIHVFQICNCLRCLNKEKASHSEVHYGDKQMHGNQPKNGSTFFGDLFDRSQPSQLNYISCKADTAMLIYKLRGSNNLQLNSHL